MLKHSGYVREVADAWGQRSRRFEKMVNFVKTSNIISAPLAKVFGGKSFDAIHYGLACVMPVRKIEDWMDTPNPFFDMDTPSALIQRGYHDEVWFFIYRALTNKDFWSSWHYG